MQFLFKRKIILTIFIIVLIVFVALTKVNQQLEMEKLSEDKARLEADIDRLELLKKNLEEELKNVDSKEFVEEYARKKFRMVKENEMIFIINENEN